MLTSLETCFTVTVDIIPCSYSIKPTYTSTKSVSTARIEHHGAFVLSHDHGTLTVLVNIALTNGTWTMVYHCLCNMQSAKRHVIRFRPIATAYLSYAYNKMTCHHLAHGMASVSKVSPVLLQSDTVIISDLYSRPTSPNAQLGQSDDF